MLSVISVKIIALYMWNQFIFVNDFSQIFILNSSITLLLIISQEKTHISGLFFLVSYYPAIKRYSFIADIEALRHTSSFCFTADPTRSSPLV